MAVSPMAGHIVSPRELAEFFELLGSAREAGDRTDVKRSQPAILPGVTHFGIMDSTLLHSVVEAFLG